VGLFSKEASEGFFRRGGATAPPRRHARIDRIDLHLLTETLLRVSESLQLPRIQIAFSTGCNLPSEEKFLCVSVENKDGRCSMRFSLLENAVTEKESTAELISGAK